MADAGADTTVGIERAPDDAAVPTLADANLGAYDFIDLGGSKGGSVRVCERLYSAKGIGIDLDERKVLRARSRGVDVVHGDATALDVEEAVRFVSMFDFLEHLPSLDHVESTLCAAVRAATDFLFISHPSFEGEASLRDLGFKQYWWDWRGHPSHITIADFGAMFDRLGLTDYVVRYHTQVEHSAHPSILPVDVPAEAGPYDSEKHPEKPFAPFSVPVWRAQQIWVAVRPLTQAEWLAILPSGRRRSAA